MNLNHTSKFFSLSLNLDIQMYLDTHMYNSNENTKWITSYQTFSHILNLQ